MTFLKLISAARSLIREGPLVQDGWVRSHLEGQSVNLAGHPIPWITYPALDFISNRLPQLEHVFEYGSGNGTLWWAARSASVRAVEHDEVWHRKMLQVLPANVELYFREINDGANYVETLIIDETLFDVIVIDGRRRNSSMIRSVERIKENGVILLDNSDRPEYADGINFLTANGFRTIDFSGFCPIVNFKSQTSIFYKSNNILGI